RRITIAGYLKWGDVTKPSGGEWDALRAHFRHAFVEVVGPLRDLDVASLPSAPKKLLEDAIDLAYSNDGNPRGAVTSHHDPAEMLLKFSPDCWFPEDPRSVEFAACPSADFAAPGNIVNELVIGSMGWMLQKERDQAQATSTGGPWAGMMKIRKEIAAVWQGSAPAATKVGGDPSPPNRAA